MASDPTTRSDLIPIPTHVPRTSSLRQSRAGMRGSVQTGCIPDRLSLSGRPGFKLCYESGHWIKKPMAPSPSFSSTPYTSGSKGVARSSVMDKMRVTSDHASGTDIPAVFVGGVRIHALTEAQCVDHVLGQLDTGCGGWMVTVNLDHLRLFSWKPEYAGLCALASLTVADGMPLVWASYLQGTPLPERVTGSNLLWSLTAAAARQGRAIFLLGGSPGTADAAAAVLRQRYSGLNVAGTDCPAAGFENDPRNIAQLVARLSTAAPDIVYVGLGKPKQDLLINQLRAQLPQIWFVGVGISFSFVSGAVFRAPVWMQRLGLEWLYRLAQEPRRLTTRYLVHGLPFAAELLGGAAIQRLKSTRYRAL